MIMMLPTRYSPGESENESEWVFRDTVGEWGVVVVSLATGLCPCMSDVSPKKVAWIFSM